jgi:Inner membrane protein YgaP-like, transmembrane domain
MNASNTIKRDKMLPRNVGTIEARFRIIVAILLLALALMHVLAGMLGVAALVGAAIALITGFTGFCPAWWLLGISTYKLHTS